MNSKIGHHRVTIEGLRLALGPIVDEYADYLDACRRKRNAIDYARSDVATETEAAEILEKAKELYGSVERSVGENDPSALR